MSDAKSGVAVTPAQLLEQLMLGATTRGKAALQHTHDVCEAVREKARLTGEVIDYSNRTLGPLISAKGGPGAKALSNPGSAKCSALIDCHARTYGGRRQLTRLPAVRALTADPQLRFSQSEVRALRAQVQALQAVVNAQTEVTLVHDSAGSSASFPAAHFGSNQNVVLNAAERKAIRDALDPKRLERLGWTVDRWGRVVDRHSVDVLPVAFASAWKLLVDRYAPE